MLWNHIIWSQALLHSVQINYQKRIVVTERLPITFQSNLTSDTDHKQWEREAFIRTICQNGICSPTYSDQVTNYFCSSYICQIAIEVIYAVYLCRFVQLKRILYFILNCQSAGDNNFSQLIFDRLIFQYRADYYWVCAFVYGN